MASKNTPVAILSAAGWLMQFISRLIKALLKAGKTMEWIHRLGTDAGREDLQRMVDAMVEAVAGKTYKLCEFFVTRSGLRVWDGFTNLLAAVSAEATPTTIGRHYDLPKTMTEAEIREKLGEGHVFEDVSTFLATLAQVIEAQWGGIDGPLFSNGYANLLFVRVGSEVVVVDVYWYVVDREWHVDAVRFGAGRRRGRGRRAFSAAEAA